MKRSELVSLYIDMCACAAVARAELNITEDTNRRLQRLIELRAEEIVAAQTSDPAFGSFRLKIDRPC